MKKVSLLLLGLVVIGCGQKSEVVTDAAMAADPTGTWIAEGGDEILLESGGALKWTQNGQPVAGKWSVPSANQLVLDLPNGPVKYRFERDMFGMKLQGENGQTVSLTTM